MKHLFLALCLIVLAAATNQASAGVIAECGASEGYAYYFSGLLVSEEDAGWQRDKISTGSVSIVELDGDLDVIFSDATGRTKSSRANGAEVFPVGNNVDEEIISVMVLYVGRVIEVYTYNAKAKKLILVQQKIDDLVNKASIMVSDCR